jgi:nucleotidyltransferase/DNA polymerase involved in DNA repair
MHTVEDAKHIPIARLQSKFGPQIGASIWRVATGNDQTPVDSESYTPKEYHHIHTFVHPTVDKAVLKRELQLGIAHICYRMRAFNCRADRWELYVRFRSPQWEGVPSHSQRLALLSATLQSCAKPGANWIQ